MSEPVATLSGVSLGGGGGRAPRRLDSVSVDFSPGVWALLGPSGAGKTSLLNLLSGYEAPDSGSITTPDTVGWAPADGALWPHLNVREHLRAGGNPDSDLEESLLADFSLLDRAESKPGQLSEGERDRLAVARAVAFAGGNERSLLVLDEPLVHVGAGHRREYWRYIRKHSAGSIVFSTHDPVDALAEADQVVCLDAGKLIFRGELDELYQRPGDPRLAGFLGPANWFGSQGDFRNWVSGAGQGGPEGGVCIRPERLSIERDQPDGHRVEGVRFCGPHEEVALVRVGEDEGEQVDRRTFFHRPPGPTLQTGDRVSLRLLPLLMMLMVSLVSAGCGGSESEIEIKESKVWHIPPHGPTLPAPRSLTCGPDGMVYVLDNAGRVLVMSPEGETVRQWPMPESDIGKPEGVLVLQDGRVVVCDTHYSRLVFFNPDGTVDKMIGRRGRAQGEFIFPVAIDQDTKGHLYVGEYGGNDRIQKFTDEGEFLFEFGGFGMPEGKFQRPSGIACHNGFVYVADAFNNRIQQFGEDGTFIGVVGASSGTAKVSLDFPYDIVWAHGGLMIIEYGAGRLTHISEEGELLGRFGKNGSALGEFFVPWGLAVDNLGRLRVADTGNRRVVSLEL